MRAKHRNKIGSLPFNRIPEFIRNERLSNYMVTNPMSQVKDAMMKPLEKMLKHRELVPMESIESIIQSQKEKVSSQLLKAIDVPNMEAGNTDKSFMIDSLLLIAGTEKDTNNNACIQTPSCDQNSADDDLDALPPDIDLVDVPPDETTMDASRLIADMPNTVDDSPCPDEIPAKEDSLTEVFGPDEGDSSSGESDNTKDRVNHALLESHDAADEPQEKSYKADNECEVEDEDCEEQIENDSEMSTPAPSELTPDAPVVFVPYFSPTASPEDGMCSSRQEINGSPSHGCLNTVNSDDSPANNQPQEGCSRDYQDTNASPERGCPTEIYDEGYSQASQQSTSAASVLSNSHQKKRVPLQSMSYEYNTGKHPTHSRYKTGYTKPSTTSCRQHDQSHFMAGYEGQGGEDTNKKKPRGWKKLASKVLPFFKRSYVSQSGVELPTHGTEHRYAEHASSSQSYSLQQMTDQIVEAVTLAFKTEVAESLHAHVRVQQERDRNIEAFVSDSGLKQVLTSLRNYVRDLLQCEDEKQEFCAQGLNRLFEHLTDSFSDVIARIEYKENRFTQNIEKMVNDIASINVHGRNTFQKGTEAFQDTIEAMIGYQKTFLDKIEANILQTQQNGFDSCCRTLDGLCTLKDKIVDLLEIKRASDSYHIETYLNQFGTKLDKEEERRIEQSSHMESFLKGQNSQMETFLKGQNSQMEMFFKGLESSLKKVLEIHCRDSAREYLNRQETFLQRLESTLTKVKETGLQKICKEMKKQQHEGLSEELLRKIHHYSSNNWLEDNTTEKHSPSLTSVEKQVLEKMNGTTSTKSGLVIDGMSGSGLPDVEVIMTIENKTWKSRFLPMCTNKIIVVKTNSLHTKDLSSAYPADKKSDEHDCKKTVKEIKMVKSTSVQPCKSLASQSVAKGETSNKNAEQHSTVSFDEMPIKPSKNPKAFFVSVNPSETTDCEPSPVENERVSNSACSIEKETTHSENRIQVATCDYKPPILNVDDTPIKPSKTAAAFYVSLESPSPKDTSPDTMLSPKKPVQVKKPVSLFISLSDHESETEEPRKLSPKPHMPTYDHAYEERKTAYRSNFTDPKQYGSLNHMREVKRQNAIRNKRLKEVMDRDNVHVKGGYYNLKGNVLGATTFHRDDVKQYSHRQTDGYNGVDEARHKMRDHHVSYELKSQQQPNDWDSPSQCEDQYQQPQTCDLDNDHDYSNLRDPKSYGSLAHMKEIKRQNALKKKRLKEVEERKNLHLKGDYYSLKGKPITSSNGNAAATSTPDTHRSQQSTRDDYSERKSVAKSPAPEDKDVLGARSTQRETKHGVNMFISSAENDTQTKPMPPKPELFNKKEDPEERMRRQFEYSCKAAYCPKMPSATQSTVQEGEVEKPTTPKIENDQDNTKKQKVPAKSPVRKEVMRSNEDDMNTPKVVWNGWASNQQYKLHDPESETCEKLRQRKNLPGWELTKQKKFSYSSADIAKKAEEEMRIPAALRGRKTLNNKYKDEDLDIDDYQNNAQNPEETPWYRQQGRYVAKVKKHEQEWAEYLAFMAKLAEEKKQKELQEKLPKQMKAKKAEEDHMKHLRNHIKNVKSTLSTWQDPKRMQNCKGKKPAPKKKATEMEKLQKHKLQAIKEAEEENSTEAASSEMPSKAPETVMPPPVVLQMMTAAGWKPGMSLQPADWPPAMLDQLMKMKMPTLPKADNPTDPGPQDNKTSNNSMMKPKVEPLDLRPIQETAAASSSKSPRRDLESGSGRSSRDDYVTVPLSVSDTSLQSISSRSNVDITSPGRKNKSGNATSPVKTSPSRYMSFAQWSKMYGQKDDKPSTTNENTSKRVCSL